MHLSTRTLIIACVIGILFVVSSFYLLTGRGATRRELKRLVSIPTTPDQLQQSREQQHMHIVKTMKRLDLPECVLYVAGLCKRGVYGVWNPNPRAADECSRALILYDRDPERRTEAMTLLYEPPPSAIDTVDSVPPFPNALVDDLLDRFRRSLPRGAPKQQKQRVPPRLDAQQQGDDNRNCVVRSDPQNSHQHSVVATSRAVLERLPQTDDGDIIPAIESYIERDCDPLITDETKAKALHALDSISTIESTQFNGLTERQALARVWNVPENRDIMVQQLASSIEHGQPICHTGKMTRIASSVNEGTGVVPMWQVKSTLYSRASILRDTILGKAHDSERIDYHHHDDSTLKDQMTRAFKSEADAYIQDHGLDPGVMRPIVDEILEHGF